MFACVCVSGMSASYNHICQTEIRQRDLNFFLQKVTFWHMLQLHSGRRRSRHIPTQTCIYSASLRRPGRGFVDASHCLPSRQCRLSWKGASKRGPKTAWMNTHTKADCLCGRRTLCVSFGRLSHVKSSRVRRNSHNSSGAIADTFFFSFLSRVKKLHFKLYYLFIIAPRAQNDLGWSVFTACWWMKVFLGSPPPTQR